LPNLVKEEEEVETVLVRGHVIARGLGHALQHVSHGGHKAVTVTLIKQKWDHVAEVVIIHVALVPTAW